MTDRQSSEYNELINNYVKSSEEIVNDLNNETQTSQNNKDGNPANIIMELRKAANHPLLRRSLYNNEKLQKMAALILTVSIIKILKIN